MAYDIGDLVRTTVTVRDPSGAPTNATTVVTVYRDDDTPYAPIVPVNDTTGVYHFDVTVDSAGVHRWVFVASGAVTAVYSGQFFVRSPGQRIVSLEEAKKHLNKTATITTDDDELQSWIDASTYVVEREIGAVVPRQVVEVYDGGLDSITLRRGPVLSVEAVDEYEGPGVVNSLTEQALTGPFTAYQFVLDAPRRLLMRVSGGYRSRFMAYGRGSVVVTYTIGRRPIPANIRAGTLEMVAHYWRTSQFASGRATPREGSNEGALVGIALPNRIAAMLGPKRAPRLGR